MIPHRVSAVVVAVVAAAALPAPAGAIILDQTFGTGGIVRLPNNGAGSMNSANAVVQLANGKLLVAGKAVAAAAGQADFGLARLNANGSLDTTFGPSHTGVVSTNFGGSQDVVNALAVQADGKIVAVGSENAPGPTGNDVAIARYTPQGNVDTTFNAPNGKLTIPIGSGSNSDYAVGVAFQPGGKIVIGAGAGASGNDLFALVRLESNGALDDGSGGDPVPADHFGTGGKVTLDLVSGDAFAEAMLKQPDGKLVLTGETDVDPSPGSGNENFDWAVARFNPNGSLDSGTAGDSNTADHFGTGGIATVGFDIAAKGYDDPEALARQSDGKIVVAGGATYDSSDEEWAFARFNSDGTLNNSGVGAFSTDGKQAFQLGPSGSSTEAHAVGLQPDGKAVGAGIGDGATTGHDFALARLTSAGDPDGSFNPGGALLTPVATGSQLDEAEDLTVAGGRIISAGESTIGPGQFQAALVSYNQSDVDNDGVADARDNCPTVKNLAQLDADHDGKGNACDPTIDGTAAADTLNGTAAAETFCGHAGADKISGLRGADTIFGDSCGGAVKPSDGGDQLFGGKGPDKLFGQGGADFLKGGNGKDLYKAGPGNDTIDAADGVAEQVGCGKGTKDVANVDQLDTVSGCETVHRS